MSHLATALGCRAEGHFQEAYWRAFDRFLGPWNSPIVKALLLAKFESADTGSCEVDRVCFGLRQLLGWQADAIERMALAELQGAAP